jgi:uncharacterized membrane protein
MLLDLVVDRMIVRRARHDGPARSWRRSLVKTVTWRLFATFDTFVISGLVTGNLRWAGSIVSIEILTKTTLYFVHERAWAWSGWGVRPARLARERLPA